MIKYLLGILTYFLSNFNDVKTNTISRMISALISYMKNRGDFWVCFSYDRCSGVP